MTIADAWLRIHEQMPPGWAIGRPSEHPERQEWILYAYDVHETPKVGLRSREWTAVGLTELDVLIEMGNCLEAISEGRVPK